MVFSKKWLKNHPKFLLYFLIHIDVLMLYRKFELILSSNSGVIATCIKNFPSLVRLWNTTSHLPVAIYEGHSYPVWDVSFRYMYMYMCVIKYMYLSLTAQSMAILLLLAMTGRQDSGILIESIP